MLVFLIVIVFVAVVVVTGSATTVGALTRADIGYVDGKAFPLTLTSIGDGHWLRADAAAAWERLKAAAAVSGVTFTVNSSFRTWSKQAALFVIFKAGGALAAEPGKSNHQSGIALDVDSIDDATGEPNMASRWLAAHAADFGFRRTVPSELWHWEFIPAA